MFSEPFKGIVTAFADETALYYADSNVNELQIKIQHDLQLLSLWFIYNKHFLNVSVPMF